MDELSARFLSAFNEIDKHLRLSRKSEMSLGFNDVVDVAAGNSAHVRSLKDELKGYGRLRNAIVHHYHKKETIATPHEKIVEQIEATRDCIQNPPIIDQLFTSSVATCANETLVSEAAETMFKESFSQLPVYEGDECQALLTTNTIARWLAACFVKDGFVIEDSPVKTVLGFAEKGENHDFLNRNGTVAEAIELFASTERAGIRLDAILITHDGTKNCRPLGIITSADIPRLYEAMPQTGLFLWNSTSSEKARK